MANYDPDADFDIAELRAAHASLRAGTAGQYERDLVEAAYHSDEPLGTRGDGLPPDIAWTAAAATDDHGRAR